MEIKIKKLHPDAVLPVKATDGAAAYDLYTILPESFAPGTRKIVRTGLAIELPHGYAADVRPRSGFSAKGIEAITLSGKSTDRYDADVLLGLIDEDYRGEIGIIVKNSGYRSFVIPAGTRLAQLCIHKVESTTLVEAKELSSTARAAGGFGSTGTKGTAPKKTSTSKKK